MTTATASVEADGLHGAVIGTDGPYGNLVTNVPAEVFDGLGWHLRDTVPVQIGERIIPAPYATTFGDVPAGAPLLYVDSRGRIALGINLGNFATAFAVTPPVALHIPRKPAHP